VALTFYKLELPQGIWNWAKKNLTKEEVKELLLATDNEGRTVFNLAADFHNLEVLRGIVSWTRENSIREEVNELLLARKNQESLCFHCTGGIYDQSFARHFELCFSRI
jgi:endo-1,4-beta-D-glucanase Y